MAQEQQLVLLYLQAIAALLMGVDYFMPDSYRNRANDLVKDYFQGIRKNIYKEVHSRKRDLYSNFPRILIGIIYIIVGIACYFISYKIEPYSIYLMIIIGIISTSLIVIGLIYTFNKIFYFISWIGHSI